MGSLKNREVLFIGIVLCLWAAVTPTFLFGQAATASISGRVTDASNAAVPGAQVTVKDTATSATQTAITDEQGRYTMPDLPIGSLRDNHFQDRISECGSHRHYFDGWKRAGGRHSA